MLEKIIIKLLKGLAAVTYVTLLLTILSTPVIFTYQAFKEPVFTFEKVVAEEDLSDDQYLISINSDTSEWTRIDYYLSASSGRFSPYYYRIEEFIPDDDSILNDTEYMLVIDEPLYFTNTITDDFVLSLYIKKDNPVSISQLMNSVLFKAKSYEKGFFEFSLTYNKEDK